MNKHLKQCWWYEGLLRAFDALFLQILKKLISVILIDVVGSSFVIENGGCAALQTAIEHLPATMRTILSQIRICQKAADARNVDGSHLNLERILRAARRRCFVVKKCDLFENDPQFDFNLCCEMKTRKHFHT